MAIKVGPGRLLTESDAHAGRILSSAELRERSVAGLASAAARRSASLREATTKSGPTSPKEAVQLMRRLGRSKNIEHGLYVTPAIDKVIAHQRGMTTQIEAGPRATAAIGRERAFTLLHNHPEATPLSVPDAKTLIHRPAVRRQLSTMMSPEEVEEHLKTVPRVHAVMAADKKGQISRMHLTVSSEEAELPIARVSVLHEALVARKMMRDMAAREKAGKPFNVMKLQHASAMRFAPAAHGSWKELADKGVLHYASTGNYGGKLQERFGRRIARLAGRATAENIADWHLKTQRIGPFAPPATPEYRGMIVNAIRTLGLFKRRPLSSAELRERSRAGLASAAARRQQASREPSRGAIALFRQGQTRPDTRARRGPWDTRSIEAPAGSLNARFTFHFPKAYRSKTPDPVLPGRPLLARALGPKGSQPGAGVTITNPKTLIEAHRHAPMRELVVKAIGVVRDHQKGAIDKAHAAKLIPEGTSPSLVSRAYKHAALLALHKTGLGDYEFGPMEEATKAEFRPLVPFMRYANRRVFDQLNVAAKGAWVPFRDEFGVEYRQKKFGQETGVVRRRMRPNQEFIKLELDDDETLEKAFHRVVDDKLKGQSKNKSGHDAHSGMLRLAQTALARAAAAHRVGLSSELARHVKPVPAPPAGDLPRGMLHAGMHLREAAEAAEKHLGLKPLRIAGVSQKPMLGKTTVSDTGLEKLSMSFSLADPNGYNTNPATQLRRAIRPRIHRRLPRLRLNTQRHLRHVLSGGITRQERWQLGASPRLPRDPFAFGKRSPIDVAAARAVIPTSGQIEPGNYRKGHVRIGGLDVSIETPKGRTRSGKKPNGHSWHVRMPAHYGYIKGTEGADGDHLDVYLGPHAHVAHMHPVFVVDQQHADTHRFDEHKAMLGFRDLDHATKTYDAAFSDKRGPERRRAVHQVTLEDFRHWVGNGDTTKAFARSRLKKGIIGAAIQYGMRSAALRGAAQTGRRLAGFTGKVAGTGARAFVGTRPGQATIRGLGRVAAHPLVAPAVHEARSIGTAGFVKSPVHSTGRIIGRAVGGHRGARIGGGVALAADYAPEVAIGAQALGLVGHKHDQQRAVRRLRAGTGIEQAAASGLGKSIVSAIARSSTRTKLGLGLAAGLATAPVAHHLATHPGERAAAGAGLAAGAVALLSRGRQVSAARRAGAEAYRAGLKQGISRRAAFHQGKFARAAKLKAIRTPKLKAGLAGLAGGAAGLAISDGNTRRRLAASG